MKPNILFILVDSFRGDKCYGKKGLLQTPNIDSLIKKGIYFEQAISSSDYTITGYGSIFTGLYPINAGIAGMSYHKIFSGVPNFISILKNNGYHTYAIMDYWSSKFGFSSYFENDDQGYDRKKLGLFNGLGNKIIKKLEPGEMIEPWFYFIHLEDLHIPIRVPEKFQNLKYDERYDLVVQEIDSWVGKIAEKINLKKTIIILTADHGDYVLSIDDSKKFSLNPKIKSKIKNVPGSSLIKSLIKIKRKVEQKINKAKARTPLEKRSIDTRTAQNRFLYDDLVHIPLLFSGCKIPSKGSVSDLVRHIDIFPTLAELLGLSIEKYKIDGRSLIPLFYGKTFEELPVYLESTIFPTAERSPIPCIGIRSSRYKYFRSLKEPKKKIYLFDLKNDPLEEQNIAHENQDIVVKMEKTMSEIRSSLTEKFKEPELTDKETKDVEEELKKLGYI